MKELANKYFDDYEAFESKFSEVLRAQDIYTLNDFIDNRANIERFYRTYITDTHPKVVICGLNPGRLGAGLTGVPFIDFKSLALMLPHVGRHDAEKSASFIFELIARFGIKEFYRDFYITNVSKFGYSKISCKKNVNYPDLPERDQEWLIKRFVEEMETLAPKLIIPLSKEVEQTLIKLKAEGILKCEVGARLNHPAWVMTYNPKEKNKWLDKYESRLIAERP